MQQPRQGCAPGAGAEYGDLHDVGFGASDGRRLLAADPVLGAVDQALDVGLVLVDRQRRQRGR